MNPRTRFEIFRKLGPLVFLLGLILAWTGCRHHRPTATIPAKPPSPRRGEVPAPIVQGEEGIASWYGHPFHGRRAASGETYNMYSMTAAHRTLPFGTLVRVHDLENNQSVVVRINDRGPFIPGRIIDLSYAAAQAMHMSGTAVVRLEILKLGSGAAEGLYAVQVGAFADRHNAEQLKHTIEQSFRPVTIETSTHGNDVLNLVLVGQEPTERQAETLAHDLIEAKMTTEAFVVRVN